MKQSTLPFKYIPKNNRSSQSDFPALGEKTSPTKESATPPKQLLLHTIGYGGHPSFDAFIDRLKQHGIEILVDVRISPHSAYMDCFKHNYFSHHLKKDYGIDYLWLKELGNPYHSKENSLVDFSAFLEKDLEARMKNLIDVCTKTDKVAILCGCKHYKACHRNVIAQSLKKNKNAKIIHIGF